MTVECHLSENDTLLTIKVFGSFDHDLDDTFVKFYQTHKGIERFVVDLTQVDHIDGSALGMLLTFRSHVHPEGPDSNIQLVVADNKELKRLVNSLEIRSLFNVIKVSDLEK